jgi:hypothetical protein
MSATSHEKLTLSPVKKPCHIKDKGVYTKLYGGKKGSCSLIMDGVEKLDILHDDCGRNMLLRTSKPVVYDDHKEILYEVKCSYCKTGWFYWRKSIYTK